MAVSQESMSSEAGFDARWLWLNIKGALGKDEIQNISLSAMNIPITPALAYPFTRSIEGFRHLGVPQNAGMIFGYHGVGKCIYCGQTEYAPNLDRDLGEEHIIPAGLGAAAVLPLASCKRHENVTSKIETKLLQTLFDPTRKQRDVRGRSRKPMKKSNFRVFRTVDGVDLGMPMPIKDHPTVLFLPRLGPPGILTGRPQAVHGVTGCWLANINAHAEILHRQRINSFATPAVDTILLAQLLAKIAHSFAAAEVLCENFEPLLIDFIEFDAAEVQNETRRYYFVGGDVGIHPPTPFLHELGMALYEYNNQTYLLARIRLFAYLGAPVFYVATGIVPPSKKPAAVARLTQNNSRTHTS